MTDHRETPPLRRRWQKVALDLVPPHGALRGRNAAITREYARLYLSQPALFKRMGVSAFSSHRVGILLALYDVTRPAGPLTSLLPTIARGDRRLIGRLRANLDLMRVANNEVYDETAWAHFAYGSDPDRGLEVIEEALDGDRRHALLLEGFREIDRGLRLSRDAAAGDAAQEAVWRGNMLLMRHEQEVIIQPHFARIDPRMGRFMSLLTWMDFDLETILPPPRRLTLRRLRRFLQCTLRRTDADLDFTWFQGCLWLHARHLLRASRSWPNVRSLEHRWYWIEHHVMPLWRRVEREDPTLVHKMRHILAGPLLP